MRPLVEQATTAAGDLVRALAQIGVHAAFVFRDETGVHLLTVDAAHAEMARMLYAAADQATDLAMRKQKAKH